MTAAQAAGRARVTTIRPSLALTRKPAGLEDAAELLDLGVGPAGRGDRQLARLEAQVLDRRPLVRPGRGGGLQHRLEVAVGGLAGVGAQGLGLAQHDGAGVALDVGVGDPRIALLHQRLDRRCGAPATSFFWCKAQRLRPTICATASAATPMRTGRQAGLIAWRSQSRAARAPRVLRARSNWRRFHRLRAGLQQALLDRHHHHRRAEPLLGGDGGGAARRSSGSSPAAAAAPAARARPPSRRTVATPSTLAQVRQRRPAPPDRPRRGRGSGRSAARPARPSARPGRRRRRPSAAPRARPAARPGRPRRPRSARRRRPAARPRGGPRPRPRAGRPRSRRPARRAAATPAPWAG